MVGQDCLGFKRYRNANCRYASVVASYRKVVDGDVAVVVYGFDGRAKDSVFEVCVAVAYPSWET
jgi:hypothetical protein